MRIAVITAIAGLACLDACRAQAPSNVTDLVAKSIAATGGYDALASVRSIKRSGSVSVTLFGQSLQGSAEVVIVPWRKSYQLLDVGIERRVQVWDGVTAWEDSHMNGRKQLDPGEAMGIRLQSVLHPLVGYQMLTLLGARMELTESKTWQERSHAGIRIVFQEDLELRVYLDQETHLVGWVEVDVPIKELGMTATLRLEYSDYAEFGGVMLAQQERLKLGEIFDITTNYKQTQINVPLEDATFTLEAHEE